MHQNKLFERLELRLAVQYNVPQETSKTGSLPVVELGRIELPTYSLQSYRSTN